MKKRTQSVSLMKLAGVFVVVSLLMSGVCLAENIIAVHGNSGRIEFMDRVASTERQLLGWGLDIEQKPGLSNWLHYSIPTVPFSKTRYLLVYYETGNPGSTADSMISRIHVYDGGTKIYENNSLNLTGGPDYTLIDMGEDKTISWALDLPSVLVQEWRA